MSMYRALLALSFVLVCSVAKASPLKIEKGVPVPLPSAACARFLKIANYDLDSIRAMAPQLLENKDFQWVEGTTQYALIIGHRNELKVDEHHRVLTITSDLVPNLKSKFMLQWLVGSKYHPYNSGRVASERRIRFEQIESVEAINAFLVSDQRRMQVVAPPGFGKTYVIGELLREWQVATAPNKKTTLKTLVIADRIVNREQNARELSHAGEDATFISASGLRNLWANLPSAQRLAYVKDFDLIVYDEGHHSAAPVIGQVLDEMQNLNRHVKLVGLSATPANSFRDLQGFYNNNSFWAYLDHEPQFGRNRSPMMVVDQLLEAMNRGHLTPFRNFFLFTEVMLGVKDLFIRPTDENGIEGRFQVVNPAHYDVLIDFLKPTIARSQKVAVVTNTIEEADRFKAEFLKSGLPYTVRVIHSQMKKADTQLEFENFKASKSPEIMIAVNMLNEAADIPDLELLIDLNRTASANEALQRIGRLTRLSPGKSGVDAIAFFQITAANLRELIEMLDRLQTGRLKRYRSNTEFNIIDTTARTINNLTDQQIWSRLKEAAYEFASREHIELPAFMLYPTLAEASLAAIKLGIKNPVDYENKYPDDARLPRDPKEFYRDEWSDWYHFLSVEKKKIYTRFEDFEMSVRVLGITNQGQYHELHHKDPSLPSDPKKFSEFGSWRTFNERVRENFYTYEQARLRISVAGNKGRQDYYKVAEIDPRLPQYPAEFYKGEYDDAEFYRPIYRTSTSASQAVRKIRIKSEDEYYKRHSEDSMLPKRPDKLYSDWKGWPQFLKFSAKYRTLADMKAAMVVLKIVDQYDYKDRFHLDAGLVKNPSVDYSADWKGWDDLFSESRALYYSYDEAKAAVARLKINSMDEYVARHHEDPKLPPRPGFMYKQFIEWEQFLNPNSNEYPTLREAKQAVLKLRASGSEINGDIGYWAEFKNDPRLFRHPDKFYSSEWKGWDDFLGIDKASLRLSAQFGSRSHTGNWNSVKKYTYEEARAVVHERGVKTVAEYQKLNDNRLPLIPPIHYGAKYSQKDFFAPIGLATGPRQPKPAQIPDYMPQSYRRGATEELYYTSLDAIRRSISSLGIATRIEYSNRRFEDPRLPPDPSKYEGWLDWDTLCTPPDKYSFAETKKFVKDAGITTLKKYREVAEQNSYLEKDPRSYKKFVNMHDFFDIDYYERLDIAAIACHRLMIRNMNDYKTMRHLDPRLPPDPDKFYEVEWDGEANFFKR